MSLVSGNSSPMATDKEVTVDSISQPSVHYISPLPNEWMIELHRMIHRLRGMKLALIASRGMHHRDPLLLAYIAALEEEVNDHIERANKASAIQAIHSGMSLKEFVDGVVRVGERVQSMMEYTPLEVEELEQVWSSIKKLEEFEVSFFPRERRGLVESLRAQFSSMLRLLANKHLCKMDASDRDRFLALLKEDVLARRNFFFESISVVAGQPSSLSIDRAGKHNNAPLIELALSNADLEGAAYAGSGTGNNTMLSGWAFPFLRNCFTRNKAPLLPTIGTPTERFESSDVEVQVNEQETYFQRNALLVSGAAFLAVGGTIISAALTANYENKSSHFKALAKLLSISSIGLGLSGIIVVILAFRRGHRHLLLAGSICYTSGLVTTAILVAFGILAVIGI